MPPAKICSSEVWTWVCVPYSSEIEPSKKRPSAIFSDVASAWTSTTITLVVARRSSTSSRPTRNGSSTGGMKTRPIRFTTPTVTPLAAVNVPAPRPGSAGG